LRFLDNQASLTALVFLRCFGANLQGSMIKLRSSLTSPFGRKIKVAASMTGLLGRIEIVHSDTMNPDDPLRKDNPLGKIPCLVLENGTTLYDSRVIIEYLDHLAGGNALIPAEWPRRIEALKLQALADGIVDAAVLVLYEGRFRAADKHDATWLAHQTGKRDRGLEALEASLPSLTAKPDIGAIAIACALDWLEFRFATLSKGPYPKCKAFLSAFQTSVPDFAESAPKG
jgi:glutathione S-transferase